jgi:hypothetical protein
MRSGLSLLRIKVEIVGKARVIAVLDYRGHRGGCASDYFSSQPSSQRVVRILRRALQPVMYRQKSTFLRSERSERMHRRSRSVARIKFHLELHPDLIDPSCRLQLGEGSTQQRHFTTLFSHRQQTDKPWNKATRNFKATFHV